MCSGQNHKEHGDEDVRQNNVDQIVSRAILDVVSGDEGGIEKEPYHSSCATSTVSPTVMEDLGESATDGKWKGVRNANGNFVEQIDKVLLSEEESGHEICRRSAGDIVWEWDPIRLCNEANECNQVGSENHGKDLPVCRIKVDYRNLTIIKH